MKEAELKTEFSGINWLEQNERVAAGITIINSIPQENFIILLDRIIKVKSKQSAPLNSEEIIELSALLKLNIDEVKLALKTLLYVYDRVSKFLFKSSELQKYLKDILKLTESKSEELVKQWAFSLKNVFKDRHNVTNIKWNLNMQVASASNSTEAIPTATLQFETNPKENVTLNLNYSDVLHLYNALESVQNEIDYIETLNAEK